MSCLNTFAAASGRLPKSKLYVSPNVSRPRAQALSGIPLTENLGVIIIHGPSTKQDFSHVVDKVRSKLAAWQ